MTCGMLQKVGKASLHSRSMHNHLLVRCTGFRKKLVAVAKQTGCELIAQWQKSIINHMYWCVASTPSGNGEMVKAKWLSLVNHIHNVHTGHGDIFSKCVHGRIRARKEKKWFKRRECYLVFVCL